MPSDRQLIRFGVFEVDLPSGELRRSGVKVHLQEQPFQVLAALLARPGQIVSKEELRERIWADDTYVDFDRSLATAVNKVRQALGDSATRPRFIETVPKRGYRFLALDTHQSSGATGSPAAPSTRNLARPLVWFALVVAAVVAGALVQWTARSRNDAGSLTFSPPQPFTSEMGYEVSPSFSPDGNQIAFAWDGPDRNDFDLYTGLVGSSTRRALTETPENEYSPAWSPDGLRIAFARESAPGRLGVFVMPAIGGSPQFIAEVAGNRAGMRAQNGIGLMYYPTISWTPDGKWLLTADRQADTDEFRPVLLSVETGHKRNIGEDVWGRTAAMSPSGNALAVVGRDLWHVPLGDDLHPNGEAEKLTDFTMALGRPAWTADGENLLITGVPDDESLSVVRLISLDGTPPRRILELGDQVAQPTVSPGGRLAFVRRMNDHNIWTLGLPEPTRAGESRQVIASTYNDMNPEFSPDGSRIVFVSSRSGSDEIWLCDNDGGNPVQLTRSGEHGVGSPTWSPDGRFIAFDGYAEPRAPLETSRHYLDWEILVVRSDGGGAVRRLTFSGGNAGPDWSPDGEWIYYVNIRSLPPKLERIGVEGGRVELIAENAGAVRLSPDGEWVYFGRRGQVWRKPAGGGAEEVVIEEGAGPFAVTDRGVYFVASESPEGQTAIAYLDLGSGAISPVYRTPKRLSAWMDVSADGRRLAFNLLDQQGSDIMLVADFLR